MLHGGNELDLIVIVYSEKGTSINRIHKYKVRPLSHPTPTHPHKKLKDSINLRGFDTHNLANYLHHFNLLQTKKEKEKRVSECN